MTSPLARRKLEPREPRTVPSNAQRPRALIVMGVSGVGKTTIAKRLAKELDWEFRDGDSFHPPANVAKMSSGIPLTDEDRAPWLDAIGAWLDDRCRKGAYAIATCSALKQSYRKRLVSNRKDVRLVHLHGDRKLIADRIGRRKGHFMPSTLLDSQFATLEMPKRNERVIQIDVAMPPARCVDRIIEILNLERAKTAPAAGHRPAAHAAEGKSRTASKPKNTPRRVKS